MGCRGKRDAARQELEVIRSRVRKAPRPEAEDAPEWLGEIEGTRDFFDSTAHVWDRVFGPGEGDGLYREVAAQIEPTGDAISILVLGCGTGLELPEIFARVPNANIAGIDIAPGMLTELRRKFGERSAQIELIEGSYLDVPLGQQRFDYAVATLTAHHPAAVEQAVVIPAHPVRRSSLVVATSRAINPPMRRGEAETLRWYNAYIAGLPGGEQAHWNYDVTLSPQTQRRLLWEAGFRDVQLAWQQPNSGGGLAVFVGTSGAGI